VKANKNNNRWVRSYKATSLDTSGGYLACHRERHPAARTGARESERAGVPDDGHSAGQDARLYGREDARCYMVGLARRARNAWLVRSVTDCDGRRAITLYRLPSGARTFLSAASRDKGIVRLETVFAPEDLSAFQPLTRVPRSTRRRHAPPSGLQPLNAC